MEIEVLYKDPEQLKNAITRSLSGSLKKRNIMSKAKSLLYAFTFSEWLEKQIKAEAGDIIKITFDEFNDGLRNILVRIYKPKTSQHFSFFSLQDIDKLVMKENE